LIDSSSALAIAATLGPPERNSAGRFLARCDGATIKKAKPTQNEDATTTTGATF